MKAPRARRGGRTPGSNHPIDIHIGSRVRLRRNMLRLSQEKLGEKLRLTFQQVQKYERGANRIGASRLWELHEILQVPVSFFYEHTDPVRAEAIADIDEPITDITMRDDVRELVTAYYGIPLDTRRRLINFAKAIWRECRALDAA